MTQNNPKPSQKTRRVNRVASRDLFGVVVGGVDSHGAVSARLVTPDSEGMAMLHEGRERVGWAFRWDVDEKEFMDSYRPQDQASSDQLEAVATWLIRRGHACVEDFPFFSPNAESIHPHHNHKKQ